MRSRLALYPDLSDCILEDRTLMAGSPVPIPLPFMQYNSATNAWIVPGTSSSGSSTGGSALYPATAAFYIGQGINLYGGGTGNGSGNGGNGSGNGSGGGSGVLLPNGNFGLVSGRSLASIFPSLSSGSTVTVGGTGGGGGGGAGGGASAPRAPARATAPAVPEVSRTSAAMAPTSAPGTASPSAA